MANKKDVAIFFLYAPKVDGHRLLIETVVDALKQQGYEIHVLTSGADAWVQTLDVEPHFLPIPKLLSRGLVFQLLFALVSPITLILLAWSTGARLLLVFSAFHALLASLSSPFTRLRATLMLDRIFWDEPSIERYGFFSRMLRVLLGQLGVFLSRAVITSTNAAARSVQDSIPGARISPLSFSLCEESAQEELEIDLPSLLGFPKKSRILGVYDSLDEKAGIEMVLRAVSASGERNLCVVLFSEGAQRGAAESIAVSLGLHERFCFYDDISQSRSVATQCDAFVLSPKCRAVSPWLIELLSSGALMLAPDVPAFREVLHYEEFLYPGDDVEVLSKMMLRCISSESGTLLGKKRLRAEQFSFDYPSMLEAVLEGQAVPRDTATPESVG